MICDRCAEPAQSVAIRLCRDCRALADAGDHRGIYRTALDRRRQLRDERINRYFRESRRRRRSAGVCTYAGCGETTPAWFCPRHMRRHSQAMKASKQRARARGYCMVCVGRPQVPGLVICQFCRDRTARFRRRRLARREAAGVCLRCGGGPVVVGRRDTPRRGRPADGRYCASCLTAARVRVNALRVARHQAGRCLRCGGARDGAWKTCAACRARQNVRRRQAAEPR